jgi:hypothetical protein
MELLFVLQIVETTLLLSKYTKIFRNETPNFQYSTQNASIQFPSRDRHDSVTVPKFSKEFLWLTNI